MGGGTGTTLVDGVRRLFQRLSTSSSSAVSSDSFAVSSSSSYDNGVIDSKPAKQARSDLVVEDLGVDEFGLKLIRVPIRTRPKTAPTMHSHKKVVLEISLLFFDPVFCSFLLYLELKSFKPSIRLPFLFVFDFDLNEKDGLLFREMLLSI